MLQALKTGGEKGLLQKNLEIDLKVTGQGSYATGVLAGDYAQLGEKGEAFAWLEKAFEAREGQDITLLKCDPTFKNLRGDPRFSDMLRRMGLPE